ncbi:hypothetical protein LOY35_13000 [Pseudomonas sp. B21-028]|uniref:hypothetical protein n=1 Tax=Pseudomonas sp. B21-028 TaxID=2895480 RepID=UPI00215E70A2|nr:hypothetical protein [Pseudomonas sp. B21-028]UVL86431.1 hypothetical protein LOY35_13000 [Pseudomonas sp. B21-028]
MSDKKNPDWVGRGKTIKQLISELQYFESENLLVEISTDDGVTKMPISLVVKAGGVCLLLNCGQ